MPRKPGSRIESPATLGRKCWAFAYLAQIWPTTKPALQAALQGTGLSLASYIQAYDAAVPLTMGLCQKVMANCFANASYDPAVRNGTCSAAVGQFYCGFQWENGASVKSHDAVSVSAGGVAQVRRSRARPSGCGFAGGLNNLDDDTDDTNRQDCLQYPFPTYAQDDRFRAAATLAVNTALNFII